MDLWLFNTAVKFGDITLWCIDNDGRHHSVEIVDAPSSFCVCTPDARTCDRLMDAVLSINRMKQCQISVTKEINATVDENRVSMRRLTVPARQQKDIESLLASSFQLCDTGCSALQHLFRDGLSCNTWIHVIKFQKLDALPDHEFRFRCSLKDLDFKRYAGRTSLPKTIRALGFDIETAPLQVDSRIVFDEHDPVAVIQFTTYDLNDAEIMSQYQKGKKERDQGKRGREPPTLPIETHVFAVGSCETQEELEREIDPCQVRRRCVYFYPTEIEMLMAACRFVRTYAPVYIVSYNGNNFDFTHLVCVVDDIMEKRNFRRFCPSGVDSFEHMDESNNPLEWSLCGTKMSVRKQTIRTAQAGTRQKYQLRGANSFVSLDLFIYCLEYQNQLTQYTLNNVVATHLGMSKIDISYDLIAPLLASGDEGRRKLILYGAVDAELVVILGQKLQVFPFYSGLSNVAGPSIGAIQSHGQQHFIKAAFLRECVSADPPLMLNHDTGSRPWMFDFEEYKGATVVTPKLGLHRSFIATLDFASLYPSIMISHNICQTSRKPAKEGGGCPDGCHEVFCYGSAYDDSRNQELARDVVKKQNKQKSKSQNSLDIRQFMGRSSSSSDEDASPPPARATSFRDMPTVLDLLDDPTVELGTDTYAFSLSPPCYFTDNDVFEGTSVRALKKLATYRKEQKRLMAIAYKEGRGQDASIHNGLQLAFKICMNSLYGFFGAKSNSQYCREVAASVCATGRGMLMAVICIVHRHLSMRLKDGTYVHCYIPRKKTVEEGGGPTEWFCFRQGKYVALDGPPDPAQVVYKTAHSVEYGDTDSVFVSLDLTGKPYALDGINERLMDIDPNKEFQDPLCFEAILLCERMCESVNRHFKSVCGDHSTISLSYEKLWLRLALQDKKKYAGLRVDEIIDRDKGTMQYPYQKCMGLDTVRRSTAPFAKKILQEIITHLTYDDTEAAKRTLLNSVKLLKTRKFDDLTDFLCTKKFSQQIKDYEKSGTLPIHIALAKRLIADGAPDRPTVGDRVPFFVVVGSQQKSLRGVSPRELAEQGLDLCLDHYLELLLNSCAKLFKFYFTTSGCEVEMRKLLQGWCDKIAAAPTRNRNTLFGTKRQCANCGQWGLFKATLCAACSEHASDERALVEIHRNKAKEAHARVLRTCGDCMRVDADTAAGQDIINTCFSYRCKIFYHRKETQKALESAERSVTVTERAPDIEECVEDCVYDDEY